MRASSAWTLWCSRRAYSTLFCFLLSSGFVYIKVFGFRRSAAVWVLPVTVRPTSRGPTGAGIRSRRTPDRAVGVGSRLSIAGGFH